MKINHLNGLRNITTSGRFLHRNMYFICQLRNRCNTPLLTRLTYDMHLYECVTLRHVFPAGGFTHDRIRQHVLSR
jgi:hypothetical protein